ncbi:hypothetical protein PoB_004693200 [Plakobranchus ocellatus]|uniref:Uncharacterized protein n=1 Tax=Plakobranchus ocellatus TaxID=259542 RepID=A0AAV4BM10_9GAST|nr:hypothetical protein PoB_004693200 [Plakobranchus ocellatus]
MVIKLPVAVNGFDFFGSLRQARTPVAGLEPASEGFLQLSRWTNYPLCDHRSPTEIKKKNDALPGRGGLRLLGLHQARALVAGLELTPARARSLQDIRAGATNVSSIQWNKKMSGYLIASFRSGWFLHIASPQQGDLRLLGPPSGQGAGGVALNSDRMVLADLRADSLTTEPRTPSFRCVGSSSTSL